MTVTELFKLTAESQKRIVINQGGRWSSKTRSISQVLATKLIQEDARAVVAGPLWPVLKRGVINDWETVIADEAIAPHLRKSRQTTSTYRTPTRFKSGGQLEFAIFQTERAARSSGKYDYLFINEADNMPWEVAQQLIMGTGKQVFIDFNPVAEFWVHEQYEHDPTADWFYSSYRNNPFCPKTVIDMIEGLRDTDMELYKIYGLGKRGNIQGVVFPNVEYKPTWPHQGADIYSIDPGFSSSPLAMCALKVAGREIHGQELIYETGMTDPALIERLQELQVPFGSVIVVDSSASQTIHNLQSAGYAAVACVKGSVKDEVKTMRGYKWYITEDSLNWKKEQRTYVFAKDKMTGKTLDVPVKNNDHLWDASRYGMSYLIGGGRLPYHL